MKTWGRPAAGFCPPSSSSLQSESGWCWQFRQNRGESPSAADLSDATSIFSRSPRQARVEAALLVADAPLSLRRLVQIATLADAAEAQQILQSLNAIYDGAGTPFRIERLATGYRLLTRPDFAHWLGRLHQRQTELKLTPAALETLTILAYRQPMTRADLEAIRGVQCTDLLRMLMERGLVRIAGEDPSLGRPYLYETTRKFLEIYGLRSLDDLPNARHLRVQRLPPDAASDIEAA